jgi:Fic family protein
MPETIPHISLATLNRIARIDEFKGRWESQGRLVANRLKALQRIAGMEAVAAAARMRGIRCSDRQIGEFLNGLNGANYLSREEEELLSGFHRVSKLVNDSYARIAFSESHVGQMHGLLTNNGKLTGARDPATREKLSGLLEQVNQLLGEGRLHPLLIISNFSRCFWHLRPFQHGNNRLTWLLSKLLLLRGGYCFMTCGAIEHFLEKRLADYQRTLPATAGEVGNFAPQAWLDLFLDALGELQENIAAKIDREKQLLKISGPRLEIIRVIQDNGQSTMAQLVTTTNMNRNTLKVRLRALVAAKHLVQRGCGKATYYLLPDPHRP